MDTGNALFCGATADFSLFLRTCVAFPQPVERCLPLSLPLFSAQIWGGKGETREEIFYEEKEPLFTATHLLLFLLLWSKTTAHRGVEKKRVKQKKLLVFFSDKRQKETCQASGARTQTFPIHRPRFAPLKSVFVRRFRVKENGLAFRYMCTVSLEAISIFFDHLYSACV